MSLETTYRWLYALLTAAAIIWIIYNVAQLKAIEAYSHQPAARGGQ